MAARSRPWEPDPIYTWDVIGDGASEAGVSRDRDKARDAAQTALRRAPEGCMVVVRRVALPPSGRSVYMPVGRAVLGWLASEDGAVLWAE